MLTNETNNETIDPDLLLSEQAINALKEFYLENSLRLNSDDNTNQKRNDYKIEENWQLSQFWYNEETASYLSDQVINALNLQNDSKGTEETINKSIACISCPTLFDSLYKKLNQNQINSIDLVLFEFDQRFEDKYPNNYVFYDYNEPISETMTHRFNAMSFDAVIADPPFLSEECLRKTVETIKYLAKDKVLVCTGAVMKDLVEECLQLEQCQHFRPKHIRNLGNDFKCYSNFELTQTRIK